MGVMLFLDNFKKGSYFYENQILMIVVQWQHNMKFEHRDDDFKILRWGRLYIWRDSQWLLHGWFGDVRYFWIRLTRNVDKFKNPVSKWHVLKINAKMMLRDYMKKNKIVKFWLSLDAYLQLYKHGFSISRSVAPDKSSEINRFWWNGKIIDDMADIDRVGLHYNTLLNGKVRSLTFRHLERPISKSLIQIDKKSKENKEDNDH
jgi:hypothetical protein